MTKIKYAQSANLTILEWTDTDNLKRHFKTSVAYVYFRPTDNDRPIQDLRNNRA